jgi:hypothetical protein
MSEDVHRRMEGDVTGLGAASRAGAHVSCATGQGSVLCLCTSLGSLLFDLTYDTHFISITITSWDILVYALPPLYYYIRDPLLVL